MEEKQDKQPESSAIPKDTQPKSLSQPLPSTPADQTQPLWQVGREDEEHNESIEGTPSHVVEPRSPREGYEESAESATRKEVAAEETRMEGIRETAQPYSGPPPTARITVSGGSKSLDRDSQRPGDQEPPVRHPRTGGDLTVSKEQEEGTILSQPPHTEVTPEGPKPDLSRSPGEAMRRKGTSK